MDREDGMTTDVIEEERNEALEHDERERIHAYRRRAKNITKNIVIGILALTTLFGAYQYQRATLLQRRLNAQYNRAFYEMTGYVQNVEIMLMKAMLTSSPELAAKILEDVWHQAELVSTNLGQLPMGPGVLSNTQKFISQVGDYAKSMNYQSINGTTMDTKQVKTIENLHKYAVTLEDNLNELQGELNAGNLKWENLDGEGRRVFSETSQELPKTFDKMDNSFQEMPTLIYDGPFSEHMSNRKALALAGGEKIDENEAIERLSNFFGKEHIRNIKKVADNKNGIIDTYNFRFELRGKERYSIAEADVSMIGGKIVWFLYDRDVGDKTIDINKAKEIGKNFLDKTGFPNMKDTYYTEQQGVATINYAYLDNGVTVYADLIKVKVALDNGEVVGFESKGYLMSNRDRNIGTPAITEAQARAKIAVDGEIQSTGLAIIPTDYGKELLVYEFKGKRGDKDFLIYINAMTGAEEKILLIINSEEGILTM